MIGSPRHQTGRCLVLWGDARERAIIHRALASAGCRVEVAADSAAMTTPLHLYRLIILDYDSMPERALGLFSKLTNPAAARPGVVVMTQQRNKQRLSDLLAHRAVTNVIIRDGELDAADLLITAQKWLTNDIFGLEKYLPRPARIYSHRVQSSTDKGIAIEHLDRLLDNIQCSGRLRNMAANVAEELITNAVYNAPVDARGRPKYRSRSRSEPVQLEPGEESIFDFACDGRHLVIAMTDQFGRLDSTTVKYYLRKCLAGGATQVDNKPGGAGIGLYQIFESINRLIVNVAPMRRTQLLATLDISGSYRGFVAQQKSLHLFEEGA